MPKIHKCCVSGCHENSRNIIEEISFHRIPKDEFTRTQWIDIIRANTKQSHVFPIEAMVCSKHFPKTSFVDRVNGSRFLQKNSFPTIFPNLQEARLKTDWSDNDDEVCTDPLEQDLTYTQSSKPQHSSGTTDTFMIDGYPNMETDSIKEEDEEDDSKELLKSITFGDFEKNCRFCLTIPKSTQIENALSSQAIAEMYKSVTGLEFCTHNRLDTICITCSSKLKSSFEFRAQLIKMSSKWEILLQKNDNMKTVDAFESLDPILLQPKLEVVILDNENSDFEAIEEYLDDEFIDDEIKAPPESEEDDIFIQNVENFIKSVKPTKKKVIKPVKPSGKIVSSKNAKIVISNSEKLNFRSTSCPHSSQKLKKYNKWWRLMHDCNYCDAKDFLTIVEMTRHLKLHHPHKVKVTCDICKKDYSELKYLRKHMKYVHQVRRNICTICNKSFYYNYNLKSHMLSHNNVKTVICHFCGKFFTPASLHQHLRTGVHGGQDKNAKTKSQGSKIPRYYCHLCVPVRRFKLCSDLTEHRRLEHNDFECVTCKGWFSCMEALQNHLKTHSRKERKHSCTICASTFVRASHLEGHIRRKHSPNPKPIACDECSYRCVEPYELTAHKKHSHSKLRPYKCNHCEKTFTHAQALKDHILTMHNIGEYRYSCSQCPKRFTNSSGLIHHRGIHHFGAVKKTTD